MKRLLAVLLMLACTTAAQAAAPLLKDIQTGIGMATTAPVQMGAYWYFNSCNSGTGCELWRTDGTGPGTAMVADIWPGYRSSDPQDLVVLGTTLFFSAQDETHGRELWKSDGTASGTVLVLDLDPGQWGSNPHELTVAGSVVFFVARTAAAGQELWKSDGTAGGTVLVRDTVPGSGDWQPEFLRALGPVVLFVADGRGVLWRSDGTEEGTVQVHVPPVVSQIERLTVAGSLAFFSGYDGTNQRTYRTDGTPEGTFPVAPYAYEYVVAGSRVFFGAFTLLEGWELWVSDGSFGGTRMVKDIVPGGPSGAPDAITPFGNRVLFIGFEGAFGPKPWISDGTEAGTVRLASAWTGKSEGSAGTFAVLGSTAVFISHVFPSPVELWATDGSPAGTHFVKELSPGDGTDLAAIIGKAGPYAYLRATDADHGFELWRTDGTAPGTVFVSELTAGAGSEGSTDFVQPHAIGGRLLFSIAWGSGAAFVADGNPGSAAPLVPPAAEPNGGAECGGRSVAAGGIIYFAAADSLRGCELWRTDGTAGGTVLVKDIRPGPGGSSPLPLAVAGGWLYFAAIDVGKGYVFWRSDGAESGTAAVGDGVPVEVGDTLPDIHVAGGMVYFWVRTAVAGAYELWFSAIGAPGAQRLSDLHPGLVLDRPDSLTAAGSRLFFAANDGIHGREIWTTDGTAAGTRLVKDLVPGSAGLSSFWPFGAAGETLLFYLPGSTESELWASDGTDVGTAPLKDEAGNPVTFPTSLTSAGPLAWFISESSLWRSDGTQAGTRRVFSAESPGWIIPAGPWVYFTTADRRLWRTDGTVTGTVRVWEYDFWTSRGIDAAVSFGRRLYFVERRWDDSMTMYRSDGDTASTVALFDFAAGTGPYGRALAAIAAGVFVLENDPRAGKEPAFLASSLADDSDGDGIPDIVEPGLGRDAQGKDNDIFATGLGGATLFAMQQYRDFLGREGEAEGIAGWANAVSTGAWTRAQVIDAFLGSQEFAGFVAPVVRLYFAAFLRVPDYAGLTFNAGLVRNGTVTLAQLADFFATSPEFASTYGALDNNQFVTLLYDNALGRTPDPDGLNGWVALLNGGYTRGQVLLGFSDSVEYQAAMANEVFVTMMYSGMLRRTPDPAGFSGWVNYLDAGTYTREQVNNGFYLSTEYRARFLP